MSACVESKLGGMIASAADAAFSRYCADPMTRLYLYYLPARGEQWGRVFVAARGETGEGAELATGEHIPRNANRDELLAWVRDRARRLPVCGK